MDADVLVVGAGPAGSTTAYFLARQGWDVLLVDRARFPRPKTCGDGLTPRAVAALQRLGLLPQLLAAGYPRIEGARLVAPDGHEWRFRFADCLHHLPGYGLVVPRLELDERLRQHAVAAGARFLGGFHARIPLSRDGRIAGVQGWLDGQVQTIRARLIVVATGVSIGLPRALGVVKRMPPVVRAARAYFAGVEELDQAFEFHFRYRHVPGYAWVFPGPGGSANVGVGLFPLGQGYGRRNVRQLLDDFMARPEMRRRFRHARMMGPIRSYPLRTDYPDGPVCGPGFLLVGEAAGLVNPVTGEGIDLALESGEIAATAAGEALRRGEVGGSGLRGYERALRRRFGSIFAGLRRIGPWVMRPRALNILIAKAARRPGLAAIIVGIIQSTVSPWAAFSPRTWWYILF